MDRYVTGAVIRRLRERKKLTQQGQAAVCLLQPARIVQDKNLKEHPDDRERIRKRMHSASPMSGALLLLWSH